LFRWIAARTELASLSAAPVISQRQGGRMPKAKDRRDSADGSAPRPASGGLTAEQEATWFAYMRVALRLNYEINRELQVDGDLSHQDFHVLNTLADSPGQQLQLSDPAIQIGWERSRVSHQVLRMEARGLVERRHPGDPPIMR
jgi:hypothetical protein